MASPGNTHGKAGQGSEQLDVAEDVPAHCRELDWMALKVPSKPKPSVIPWPSHVNRSRPVTAASKSSAECTRLSLFCLGLLRIWY